jgi:hypothetical protein
MAPGNGARRWRGRRGDGLRWGLGGARREGREKYVLR